MDPREDTERSDDWPVLSEADRRAIAEIRRELDAEYGPLPADEHPPEAPGPERRARRRRTRGGRMRTPVVITMVIVVISGAVVYVGLSLISRAAPRVAQPAPSSPAAPVAAPSTVPAGDRPTGVAPTPSPPVAQKMEPSVSSAAARSVAATLDQWLAATREGDIEGQMAFYLPVVPVYYTWRNTPRAAVLAEKRKVFGDARVLDIRTGPPEIEVSADGATALTRFRKAYVIEGPHVRRRGEVLQELRWARTATGWKIIGERDAAVLAGS